MANDSRIVPWQGQRRITSSAGYARRRGSVLGIKLDRTTSTFAVALITLCLASPALADAYARCCVLGARDSLSSFPDALPWDVCNYNKSVSYPVDTPADSVKMTMAWCLSNCHGTAWSSKSQWIQPLAAWVAPYFGLLLLCPTGEKKKKKPKKDKVDKKAEGPTSLTGEPNKSGAGTKTTTITDEKDASSTDAHDEIVTTTSPKGTPKTSWLKLRAILVTAWEWCAKSFDLIRFPSEEYIMLIGDPASALWGAGSELWTDWALVRSLKSRPQTEYTYQHTGLVILAGETEYDYDLAEDLDRKLMKLVQEMHPENPTLALTPTKSSAASAVDPDTKDAINPAPEKSESRPGPGQHTTTFDHKEKLASRPYVDGHKLPPSLSIAIRTILDARISFVNSIALPAILMLAVTASVFFDAYNKLGDNDTAHSIAYGVFYSWIIVLAILGNCFATSINAGLLNTTMGPLLDKLTFNPAVPLRDRYVNATRWHDWLERVKKLPSPQDKPKDPIKAHVHDHRLFRWTFHAKFFLGQLTAWVVVAFPCACAASISYTTPTVGVGCRSFTFMLYALLALVVACMMVVRNAIHVKMNNIIDDEKVHIFTRRRWKRLGFAVKTLYVFLALCNALLFILGTAFNLAGMYRTCRCKILFGKGTDLVELNVATKPSIDNARKYWLPVGYVAFSFAWVLCAIAVVIRKHMNLYLVEAFEERSAEEI